MSAGWIGVLKYISHVLCVGLSLALLPNLFDPGPWHQRWAIGVLIAYATRGILWGKEG